MINTIDKLKLISRLGDPMVAELALVIAEYIEEKEKANTELGFKK